MGNNRPCVLYERECIGCGECNRCDLNPEKICDNCMKCIKGNVDYRGISIDGIVMEQNPKQNEKSFS